MEKIFHCGGLGKCPGIAAALMLSFLTNSVLIVAAEFPQAEISNGQIKAKLYLPDATNGYYRSTRFDWSGVVNSLEYQGHDYYGTWYDKIDPKVINWIFQGSQIVSGPCSALMGPSDEFATPLAWDDSKPGGTFIKIGVGVLRRGDGNYNRYVPYDVLNSGKWSVSKQRDSITFKQELSDSASAYGYVYRKVVRLAEGKPEMVIEHTLKNTGKRRIKSSVYNHNFVVLDKQAPGPDFTIQLPFEIKTSRPPKEELAEIREHQVLYKRPLSGEDQVGVMIQGFSESASDSEIIIENKKVGAGVKIVADRPLIKDILWSIRTVLAVEPYIEIDIQPNAEFSWKSTLDYYILPPAKATS